MPIPPEGYDTWIYYIIRNPTWWHEVQQEACAEIYDAVEREYEEMVKNSPTPKMIQEPDIQKLKRMLTEYMNYIQSSEFYEDNEYPRHIYEAVMVSFYGPKFFEWYNKRENEK
jgi:hypothetical protein